MTIKSLVILSAFCIGIILIVLILTKQNIETDLQPQKEMAALEQTVSYRQPLPPAPLNSVTEAILMPSTKSAITIIDSPAIEPQKQIILQAITSSGSFPTDSETESNAQPGITKAGKYPAKKEAQEMQSRGIVLY